MAKEMLINVSEGEECRIALVEDGRLEELYMERSSSTSHVGNIYKGRVTNVEASIQAAFVDFGLGRNGFLHISDLMPTTAHIDLTWGMGFDLYPLQTIESKKEYYARALPERWLTVFTHDPKTPWAYIEKDELGKMVAKAA